MAIRVLLAFIIIFKAAMMPHFTYARGFLYYQLLDEIDVTPRVDARRRS